MNLTLIQIDGLHIGNDLVLSDFEVLTGRSPPGSRIARLSLRVDTLNQEVQLGQVKCHPLG
jgi:hypothetical protein